MIVLDTNVVSELLRERSEPAVRAWVDAEDSTELAITAVTAAELRGGIAILPRGRRRSEITRTVDVVLGETFAGAILPFDAASAPHYAEVLAARRRTGAPIDPLDAQIAAVCLQYDAILATRNTRDFEGVGLELVDPWTARPPPDAR